MGTFLCHANPKSDEDASLLGDDRGTQVWEVSVSDHVYLARAGNAITKHSTCVTAGSTCPDFRQIPQPIHDEMPLSGCNRCSHELAPIRTTSHACENIRRALSAYGAGQKAINPALQALCFSPTSSEESLFLDDSSPARAAQALREILQQGYLADASTLHPVFDLLSESHVPDHPRRAYDAFLVAMPTGERETERLKCQAPTVRMQACRVFSHLACSFFRAAANDQEPIVEECHLALRVKEIDMLVAYFDKLFERPELGMFDENAVVASKSDAHAYFYLSLTRAVFEVQPKVKHTTLCQDFGVAFAKALYGALDVRPSEIVEAGVEVGWSALQEALNKAMREGALQDCMYKACESLQIDREMQERLYEYLVRSAVAGVAAVHSFIHPVLEIDAARSFIGSCLRFDWRSAFSPVDWRCLVALCVELEHLSKDTTRRQDASRLLLPAQDGMIGGGLVDLLFFKSGVESARVRLCAVHAIKCLLDNPDLADRSPKSVLDAVQARWMLDCWALRLCSHQVDTAGLFAKASRLVSTSSIRLASMITYGRSAEIGLLRTREAIESCFSTYNIFDALGAPVQSQFSSESFVPGFIQKELGWVAGFVFNVTSAIKIPLSKEGESHCPPATDTCLAEFDDQPACSASAAITKMLTGVAEQTHSATCAEFAEVLDDMAEISSGLPLSRFARAAGSALSAPHGQARQHLEQLTTTVGKCGLDVSLRIDWEQFLSDLAFELGESHIAMIMTQKTSDYLEVNSNVPAENRARLLCRLGQLQDNDEKGLQAFRKSLMVLEEAPPGPARGLLELQGGLGASRRTCDSEMAAAFLQTAAWGLSDVTPALLSVPSDSMGPVVRMLQLEASCSQVTAGDVACVAWEVAELLSVQDGEKRTITNSCNFMGSQLDRRESIVVLDLGDYSQNAFGNPDSDCDSDRGQPSCCDPFSTWMVKISLRRRDDCARGGACSTGSPSTIAYKCSSASARAARVTSSCVNLCRRAPRPLRRPRSQQSLSPSSGSPLPRAQPLLGSSSPRNGSKMHLRNVPQGLSHSMAAANSIDYPD